MTEPIPHILICKHCQNDDKTLMERVPAQWPRYECLVCSKEFDAPKEPRNALRG